MYTLVGLLSLVASAAFVLAFAHGRRRHLATLFGGRRDRLVAPWSGIPRPARHGLAPTRASPSPFPTAVNVRLGRDGAVLAGAIALASGAPWSDPPSALVLAALLAPAALLARVRSDTVRLLALAAAAGVTLAWLASQLEPAWSPRSLAVLYGPVALAAAAAPARRPWAAATVVAAAALIVVPLPAKSNARTVAVSAGIGLRPEDLVISIQPEQVPVLQRYLPTGVRYLTPMGPPDDPRVMDWRDALRRLEAARPPRVTLAPGRRIVLVTPVGLRSRAPWARAAAPAPGAPRSGHSPACAGWAPPPAQPRAGSAAPCAPRSTPWQGEGRPGQPPLASLFPPLTRVGVSRCRCCTGRARPRRRFGRTDRDPWC